MATVTVGNSAVVNTLSSAVVAFLFISWDGSVKLFIQTSMVGGTVCLVESWFIVDVSCHLMTICCLILVGWCVWTVPRLSSFRHEITWMLNPIKKMKGSNLLVVPI